MKTNTYSIRSALQIGYKGTSFFCSFQIWHAYATYNDINVKKLNRKAFYRIWAGKR